MNTIMLWVVIVFIIAVGIFRIRYRNQYRMMAREIDNLLGFLFMSSLLAVVVWFAAFAIYAIIEIALTITSERFILSESMFNNVDLQSLANIFITHTSVNKILLTAAGLFVSLYTLYILDLVRKNNKLKDGYLKKTYLKKGKRGK